mmetsp:Transcript_8030/g.23995  ORF Transcript_8030/g.23995 Transcript_8030/m.23995 type:complete len:165 (+) Transcript_8030:404-898(+)
MKAALLFLASAHALVVSSPRARAVARPTRRHAEDLYLCEEHVELALDELRAEYDAVFYRAPELKMSGDVRLDSIEGCDVVLRLVGMFWHERRGGFGLASNYLRARIPEIADVLPASEQNLDDTRTQAPDLNGDRNEIMRLGHEPWETVVIRHRPGLTFTGYNIY